jgi:hypothetical protein
MVESAIRDNYAYPYAAAFPMSGAEGVSLKTANRANVPPMPVKRRNIPFFKRDGYTLKQDDRNVISILGTRENLDVCYDVLTHPRANRTFDVTDFGDRLCIRS